ncbi:hypothetical protein C8F04DRAFT_1270457 [Mycena alexandri]|uniref:Uncharacterized protein n=1 Tax=Mycena alexandri TaxID=1745969 RepID=A0AAD6SAQ7_9AGAR|nr:hypothetical protein C8F04DRAFT_1270457 [Mycena alexandri]
MSTLCRHPELYFKDGSLVLKAGDGSGMLYNVYRGPLMIQSDFFGGMLTLPIPDHPPLSLSTNAQEYLVQARKNGLEGSTDETAVEIPAQFKAAEIEEFLKFLFLQGWTPAEAPALSKVCAILKLSHFFAVDAGVEYARFNLDNNQELSRQLGPFLRLKMGIEYHFKDWIKMAFDILATIPINTIEPEDEELMGWPAYWALAKAQAEVLDHRLRLAVKPPVPNHCNECHDHMWCAGQWEEAWTSLAGPLGDFIVEELAGSEIMAKLSTYRVGGMHFECFRRTCEGLKDSEDGKSILRREEEIIDDAVQQLMNQLQI